MHLAEWLPLKCVAVRAPDSAVPNQEVIDSQWQDLGYPNRPVLEKAVSEHTAFVDILRNVGAEVVELPSGAGLTLDSIYARDTAIPSPQGVILTAMGKDARQQEPAVLSDILSTNKIPVAGHINAPGRFEGGDCVWIDPETLLIGRTYRTNDEGIRQAKELLGPSVQVEVFQMPHYKGPGDVFHLMSILSPVAHDVAVCYPPLTPVPLMETLSRRNIQIVEVPDVEFESMGCNILALGQSTVVMVQGNPQTKAAIEAAGISV